MAASAANTASPIVSGTTPLPPSSSGSSASLGSSASTELAGNFQTFLTLLTTQLQNQNPLDPLDTNQFTQQLVQFAGVEQQLKTNDELSTLVSLQQTAQSTQALGFRRQDRGGRRQHHGLDQQPGRLGRQCSDRLQPHPDHHQQRRTDRLQQQLSRPAGQNQTFGWDGKGNDGTQWPDGQYKMTATATDTAGNTVAVTTQILGVVNSVDLTQSPPLLSIGGQTYTVSQIKSISS